MTLLEILSHLVGPANELVTLLQRLGTAAPDLKPRADEWIAKLQTAVGSANLVDLASMLKAEIETIAKGQLDPHDHSSDAA